jgi:hypothetical protein
MLTVERQATQHAETSSCHIGPYAQYHWKPRVESYHKFIISPLYLTYCAVWEPPMTFESKERLGKVCVRRHRVRCMKPCYLLVWMLFSWLGVAVFVTVNGIRAPEYQVLAVAYWRMVLRQIKMDTAQKAHSTLFYIQYTDSQYDFCVALNVRSSCL